MLISNNLGYIDTSWKIFRKNYEKYLCQSIWTWYL